MHLSFRNDKPFGQTMWFAAAALVGLFAAFFPTFSDAAALVRSGFETGEFESYGWRKSGNVPRIVRSPVCRGKYAIGFPLDRAKDDISYRTELTLSGNEAGALKNLKYDEDYWLGMNVFIPSSWEADEKSIDILAQLHGVPDRDLGEIYRNPMFNFFVRGDEWFFITKRDSRAVTATSRDDMKYEEYGFRSLGKLIRGKWTSFVFHFRLSYREGQGRIDVWKNGEKIVDGYKKGVGFNDRTGPYWKIGNYKPGWKPGHEPTAVSRRIHYVDDVAVAMGADRYADVAPPRCGGSPPAGENPATPPSGDGGSTPPENPPAPGPDGPPPEPDEPASGPDEPAPVPEGGEVRKPSTPVIKRVTVTDPWRGTGGESR